MNEELNTSQLGEQLTPEGGNEDYKALYFQEIQNAKKLRGRAQEAEAMIDSYKKQQEEVKVQKNVDNIKKAVTLEETSEQLSSKSKDLFNELFGEN